MGLSGGGAEESIGWMSKRAKRHLTRNSDNLTSLIGAEEQAGPERSCDPRSSAAADETWGPSFAGYQTWATGLVSLSFIPRC